MCTLMHAVKILSSDILLAFLCLNFEYPRDLVEVVKQANTSSWNFLSQYQQKQ